ncbi:MAG: hypothetical protein AAB538_04240 [Patescibacteria group bacterium]
MTPENITPTIPSSAPEKKLLTEKHLERILVIIIIGLALITLAGGIVWLFTAQTSLTTPLTRNNFGIFGKLPVADEVENLTKEADEQGTETLSSASSSQSISEPSPAATGAASASTPSPTYARPQPRFGTGSTTATPTPEEAATPTSTPAPTPELLSSSSQSTVAAGGSASARAECPAGSTIVGGGFTATYDTEIWRSYRSGQGWYVEAHNSALAPAGLSARAQCVSGLPGAVSVRADSTTVASGAIGEVTKDCPDGHTALSGGFYADNLQVIFSNRVGNGWQIKAKNPTRSSHPLSVFVNCYSGGPITLTQIQKNKNIPSNVRDGSDVACTEGLLVMGGYSFGSPIDNSYYTTANGFWKFSTRNLTSGTMQLKVYGQCATF